MTHALDGAQLVGAVVAGAVSLLFLYSLVFYAARWWRGR